jgi:hypothetical protein
MSFAVIKGRLGGGCISIMSDAVKGNVLSRVDPSVQGGPCFAVAQEHVEVATNTARTDEHTTRDARK